MLVTAIRRRNGGNKLGLARRADPLAILSNLLGMRLEPDLMADFYASMTFEQDRVRSAGWRPDFHLDEDSTYTLYMVWPVGSLNDPEIAFSCLDRELWERNLANRIREGTTFTLQEGRTVIAHGIVTDAPLCGTGTS